jgi:hypothetical protein
MPDQPVRRSVLLSSCLAAALAISGCDGSTEASDESIFTVTGSSGAPPAALQASLVGKAQLGMGAPGDGMTSGDPSSIQIGMYALWISPHADCSEAVLVQDYGSSAAVKDFTTDPVLFTSEAEPGSYECVAMKMSDVIGFSSAQSFGTCETEMAYTQDIYREGESDWKDIDMVSVVGHGTDETPQDDGVTVVMTTDTTAAMARGFSPDQIVELLSPLSVPAASTFYWNGAGSVTTEDGRPCGLEPGHPAFR